MEQSGWGRVTVSRRGVVVAGGVVAAGAALSADRQMNSIVDELFGEAAAKFGVGKVRVERIRRGDDLLVANLVIANMTYHKLGVGGLLKTGKDPGYLALILPGQSLGENWTNTVDEFSDVFELALPTVLSFRIEPKRNIPYKLSALLDLSGRSLNHDDIRKSGTVIMRGTQIEAPYRLQISPHPTTRWLNDAALRKLAIDGGPETAELWNTRLTGQVLRTSSAGKPELAVDPRGTINKVIDATLNLQTPSEKDAQGDSSKDTFPLRYDDRRDIVRQTRPDFKVRRDADGRVTHAPVRADQLILSARGATLDLHGEWSGANRLKAWDHRATLGRDNYVRTIEAGWITPFRHPATVITETWRLMGGAAQLVSRSTLIIRDPVADTDLATTRTRNGVTFGLPFPFVSVTCAQTVSSGVLRINTQNGGEVVRELAGGLHRPLRLPFIGLDHDGNPIPFRSAVWFVPGEVPEGDGLGWNGLAPDVRTVEMASLPVAVAPQDAAHPRLTTVPMTGMVIGVAPEPEASHPKWRPVAISMDIDSPGISALSGSAGPVKHAYHPAYAKPNQQSNGPFVGGDEDNPGGIVLAATGGGTIASRNTGGLAPMPKYQGLSRSSGSILASSDAALDNLGQPSGPDVKQLINDLFAGIYLIGPLQLSDIVAPDVGLFRSSTTASKAGVPAAPGIPGVTHEVRDGRVYVDLDLTLPLQWWKGAGLAFKPAADSLQIKAHLESGAGGPTETTIDARLRNVAIEFAGIIALPIRELRARIGTGGAAFDFGIENVQFIGELAFLQPLSSFLQLGAASGSAGTSRALAPRLLPTYDDQTGTMVVRSGAPARTDTAQGVDAFVDADGLHLRAGFGIPDVPLGVFSLTGLNFGIEVNLPFGGGLDIHAWFATHEDPFQVNYCGFGGGGYVDIVMGQLPGGNGDDGKFGLKKVTASLCVSAKLGIDLVVASGELSVRVGMILELGHDGTTITAYFRISGSVSIPLVCSVSVTFELRMSFHTSGNRVIVNGTATFLLDVQVLVVSADYEATLSKSFKGGRNGNQLEDGRDPFARRSLGPTAGWAEDGVLDPEETPTFRSVHPTVDTWREYAAAFEA